MQHTRVYGCSIIVWMLTALQVVLAQPGDLVFIENKNQWPQDIDYAARVPGGRMFVSSAQFVIQLSEARAIGNQHGHDHLYESGLTHTSEKAQGHSIHINLLGAVEGVSPQPHHLLSQYYNYFIGRDSCQWGIHARAYSEIIYPGVYPGIDLRVASVGEHLKYDFIVHPEADPSLIITEYCGAQTLRLESSNLIIETSLGNLIEKQPLAYQTLNGKQVEVPSRYVVDHLQSRFHFPDGYDPCEPLIIDPLLIFSTYSGSTADNWGSTATPGENGTLYSSGITNEISFGGTFPATPGAFQTDYGGNYDIAILKYDSTGSQLLYASYLGGSSNETPHSLVMDSATQDLLILGSTSSSDFPVTTGAVSEDFNGGVTQATFVISYPNGSDIVLSRISKEGDNLVGSTYMGGTLNDGINTPAFVGGALSKNYGDEMRGDVITDPEGNVYISTVTGSPDFPLTKGVDTTYNGGGTDALVMKINPTLTQVVWSTVLGGSGFDASYSIRFDLAGHLYVAGGTNSANFPSSAGSYQPIQKGDVDGWIAHVTATGDSIMAATFTGTSAYDQIYFLDLDQEGSVFVYGQTAGPMPVTAGAYRNPNSGQFLQKFTPELDSLIISTVFGSGIGIPNISPTAFLVAECNNLYMSGWGGVVNIRTGHWASTTANMPTTADALQRTTSGSDFYFIVLTADASELLYATYLGGNQSRTHVDGGTSRFDKSGIVYHAVCSGCAAFNAIGQPTSDFPTTSEAWSQTNNSGNCNNAAFKFDLSSLRARLQTNTVDFSMPGIDELCFPDSIRFQNQSTGGEFYRWSLGDGTTLEKPDTNSFVHQYKQGGTYLVKLVAIDLNTCVGIDSVQRWITVYEPQGVAQADDDLCFGSSYQLTASGGTEYAWRSEDGTFESTLATPAVNPTDTSRYFVTITDSNGCTNQDTVTLNVVPFIDLEWKVEYMTNCFSRPDLRVVNNTTAKPDEQFRIDFGDGFSSDQPEVVHTYANDGDYTVRVTGIKEFCVYEQAEVFSVYTILVPNAITPADPGSNDVFTIQFGDTGSTPADFNIPVSLRIVNRWGTEVFQTSDYTYDWNGSTVDAGIYFYEVGLGKYATCKSWLHVIK